MSETIGNLIAQLAATNSELWHEEDKARVDEDRQVASAKRNIDKLNQRRNDLIERIDEVFRESVSAARAKKRRGASKRREPGGVRRARGSRRG